MSKYFSAGDTLMFSIGWVAYPPKWIDKIRTLLLTKCKNVFICSYLVQRSLLLDFGRVSACLVLNKISYKLIKKSLPPTQGHLVEKGIMGILG